MKKLVSRGENAKGKSEGLMPDPSTFAKTSFWYIQSYHHHSMQNPSGIWQSVSPSLIMFNAATTPSRQFDCRYSMQSTSGLWNIVRTAQSFLMPKVTPAAQFSYPWSSPISPHVNWQERDWISFATEASARIFFYLPVELMKMTISFTIPKNAYGPASIRIHKMYQVRDKWGLKCSHPYFYYNDLDSRSSSSFVLAGFISSAIVGSCDWNLESTER